MGCHLDPERFTLGRLAVEPADPGSRMLCFGWCTAPSIQPRPVVALLAKMPADIDDVDLLTSPSSKRPAPSTFPRPTQMTYLLSRLPNAVFWMVYSTINPAQTRRRSSRSIGPRVNRSRRENARRHRRR
jgi:hypothetical protein